jgi:hypothetical protein
MMAHGTKIITLLALLLATAGAASSGVDMVEAAGAADVDMAWQQAHQASMLPPAGTPACWGKKQAARRAAARRGV